MSEPRTGWYAIINGGLAWVTHIMPAPPGPLNDSTQFHPLVGYIELGEGKNITWAQTTWTFSGGNSYTGRPTENDIDLETWSLEQDE